MNKEALFCDGTQSYVYPAEPLPYEKVTLSFRTAADDVRSVQIMVNGLGYEMKKRKKDGGFDYYSIVWPLGGEALRYCFRIRGGEETVFYDRRGVRADLDKEFAFRLIPGFSTPSWAKGAVMYQIFTDRFFNGDRTNDVQDREYLYIGEPSERVGEWSALPKAMDVREFYGGDLEGVRQKLPYLKELGVEAVYFNPLFVSPSSHKYDTQDYDYIDPHFGVIIKDGGEALPEGTRDNGQASRYRARVADKENLEASNAYFIELVEELHKNGIKVILDGVFNHCGSFNKWLDKERIYEKQGGYEAGAYLSGDSPYRSYFDFRGEKGAFAAYDGWWGFDTLPKLNYEGSKGLEEAILAIGRKWVSPPYNADGWRLDVAADLGHGREYNHEFWKKFRKAVKEANPEALILAEHYGDAGEWLRGDEWDTVMNYDAFMEPVSWFLTGMEKHSDGRRPELCGNAEEFVNAMTYHMSRMPFPSLQTAMNELSNHDHSRFLTRTNHLVGRACDLGGERASENVKPAVLREAVVMQMTWVGAPTVYYGDEAGLCGFTDPDNRRTYPWGKEDKELLSFHKEMIAIHKDYQAFRTGSLKILYKAQDTLAYARFLKGEQFIVVIHNADMREEISFGVWQAEAPRFGTMRRLMYSYEEGYTTEYEEYRVENGELALNMGSRSALVLKTLGY